MPMVGSAGQRKMAYTVVEAAGLLSVSRAHLYRLIDLGQVGTIRVGRCRRITAGQLEAFVRRREDEDGAPPRKPL